MKSKIYRIFNDMDDVSFHLRNYLNNCTGHDYNRQTLEQIVADERRISELCLSFGQTLAVISNGMDREEWDVFWASLGEYIFQDEDD